MTDSAKGPTGAGGGMGTLVLLIEGCFSLLGSFLVLWWVSPSGRQVQDQMGINAGAWGPREVALICAALAAFGFVFAGGYAIQQFISTLTEAVVGGSATHGDPTVPQVMAWGLFGYLLIAVVFGAFVMTMAGNAAGFGQFAEPQFLKLVLTWPYQLMAAAGLFGLPTEAFY